MHSIRSAPAQLPAIIPVTASEGPANRGGNAPLSQVRSWRDLPDHLFIGAIDPSRFRLTKTGWEAAYRGQPEDTELKLAHAAASGRTPGSTTLEMHYRGIRGALVSYNGDDVHRLVQFAFPRGMPAEWCAPLAAALSSRYHVTFISPGEPTDWAAFSPSGPMFDLLVPLSVAQLGRCAALLRCIQDDDKRVAPVSAQLRLVTSTARHPGRKWHSLGMPETQFQGAWNATGVLPPVMPRWTAEPDGSRALTVSRAHYVVELRCYLPDVERLVGSLATLGILGLRGREDRPALADSPDYPSVLRLYRPDREQHGSSVCDETGRCIEYPAPMAPRAPAPAATVDREIACVLEHLRACNDFERAAHQDEEAEEEEMSDSEAGPEAWESREEPEHEPELELDDEGQPLADALIDALGGETGLTEHPALNAFQSWCDERDLFEGAVEVVCCGEHSIYAPELLEVVDQAVESFEGSPEVSRILAHLRATWERVASSGYFGERERPYHVAAPLRHSLGVRRVLGFVFSNSGDSIDCDGIFTDRKAYEEWLSEQGFAVRAEDLEHIPIGILVQGWGEQ